MRPVLTRRAATPRTLHERFRPIPRTAPEGPATRGLYDGEPETCRRDLRQFLPVLAHLGLLVAVFHIYHFKGALQVLTGLAAAALPIHYALPYRLKKPFFVAVSVAGLFAVLGPATAGLVVALVLGLVTLARLPVAWSLRALAIAGIAVALGLARAGLAPWPVDEVALTVAASLLMFRMILYLYELKHAQGREPWVDALAYFFLLPNTVFPLFPVVDYRAFRRGYFAEDVHANQRAGLRLLLRGTLQMLAYRVVYHRWLIPADEVAGPADLALFLVCNYLTYLHVSAQFHLAAGLLHLFGFGLPATHNNYLLASSFTDYWRRINIYWKDFMVRLVFNPVAFRLKRRPRALTLSLATMAVFIATWALHAYQSFWLKGDWGLSVPDALFWGILGALVLVNVLRDASRRPSPPARTPAARAVLAARTAGTFLTIALLWSLWYSPSLGAWLDMLRRGLGLGLPG